MIKSYRKGPLSDDPYPLSNGRYALFGQERSGPLWKEFCTDLETAKRLAQEFADREGLPHFVFDLSRQAEVFRASPAQRQLPGLNLTS